MGLKGVTLRACVLPSFHLTLPASDPEGGGANGEWASRNMGPFVTTMRVELEVGEKWSGLC